MTLKIEPRHLALDAIVYVRQSTMSQVVGATESKRRQYALVEQAKAAGFSSVSVIDDDLAALVPARSSGPASKSWSPPFAAAALAPSTASRLPGWRATAAIGII